MLSYCLQTLAYLKVGGFEVHESMADVFKKPYLVACKNWAWSWHWNSFPLPGLGSVIFVHKGCFFVKLVTVTDLREKGMTSLACLDEFFQVLKNPKKVFSDVGHNFMIPLGCTLVVPPGFIVLMTSITQSSEDDHTKSVGVVVQVPDIRWASLVPSEDTLEIKQHLLTALAKNRDKYTSWAELVAPLGRFLEVFHAKSSAAAPASDE